MKSDAVQTMQTMQTDAVQPDVMQPDVVQPDAAQTEAKQTEAEEPEAKEPEAKKPEAKKPGRACSLSQKPENLLTNAWTLVDPVVRLNNWLQRSPEGNVTRHFTWAMAQTGPSNQAVHHATAKCRYNVQ